MLLAIHRLTRSGHEPGKLMAFHGMKGEMAFIFSYAPKIYNQQIWLQPWAGAVRIPPCLLATETAKRGKGEASGGEGQHGAASRAVVRSRNDERTLDIIRKDIYPTQP